MNLNVLGGDVVAIDIGTSSIRLVELKSGGKGKYSLVTCASVPIPQTKDNVDVDSNSILPGLVSEVIKNAGISKKEVVLGIPTQQTYSVVVDLPKVEKKEDQAKTIPIQAEEHIPDSISSVDLDWHVLGDSPVDSTKMEVLLVTVDKNYNKKRIELINKLGLEVSAIEPDAYALPKALIAKDNTDAHIIIESGDLETDLIAVINGQPKLIRNIPIGSKHILSSIAKNLSIDSNQAQQYAYKFGMDKTQLEGQVYSSVAESISGVVEEVSKSIKYLNGRYGNTNFSDVLLSGFIAYMPGLSQYLQDTFKTPTIPGDPWVNVNLDSSKEQSLRQQGSIFAVASGLAMRDKE